MDYPLVSHENTAPKYKVSNPEQWESQGIEACVTKEKNSVERMHTNIEKTQLVTFSKRVDYRPKYNIC
jgi:hypothetical protein